MMLHSARAIATLALALLAGGAGGAGLTGCAPERADATRPAPETTASLSPCDSPDFGGDARCGRIEVPADPARPPSDGGATLELNVVVLPALEPPEGAPAPPLFEIPDGPGVAATDSAPLYADALAELRRERDVVLVDVRGSGESHPLDCAALNDRRGIVEPYPAAAVADCLAEIRRRADPALYTTSTIVADLDAVRAALGHARADLLGYGWGARAALEWLRRWPGHVRTVAVVGPTTAGHRVPLEQARDASAALDAMFADCAADAECAGAYPRLPAKLEALLKEQRREPLEIPYKDPVTQERKVQVLTADLFAEQLRGMLYSPADTSRLPLIIDAAYHLNYRPLLKLAIAERFLRPTVIPEGLYLSVVCTEDVPRITDADVERATAGTWFGDWRVAQFRRACESWPRGRIAEGFGEWTTDAPVLVISGGRDPVSPPRWGAALAGRLPRARHVVVPAMARDATGLADPGCVDRLIDAFLDAGTAEGLDTGCVEAMTPVPFVTADSQALPRTQEIKIE